MGRCAREEEERHHKNMCVKKMISTALGMGLLLCASACGSPPQEPMEAIYTDEDQLGSYYSSYELSDLTQEITDGGISGVYEDLNGMVMLWNYEVPKETALDIHYKMRVTSGRAKLIMVDPEGGITTIAEISGGVTADALKAQSFSMHPGLYRLKLVGMDDADAEVEIEVEEGAFIGAK